MPSTGTPFPPGHPRYGGRQKGSPARTVSQDFRRTIELLLDDHRDNVDRWLRQVANGTLKVFHGQVVGNPPDPAKALDIIAKLAEYGAPKLTRAEVVAPGGQGDGATHIQIEFIHPPRQLAEKPPELDAPGRADVVDVQVKTAPTVGNETPPARPAALEQYLSGRRS